MWEYIALAAASIFSNLFTNYQNKQITENNQKWNEQMMDKQNEYNNPSNQVQRLQDAGINPAMLGSGQIANTSAGVNGTQLFPYQDLMSTFSNNSLALMNSRKAKAEGKTEELLRQSRLESVQNQNKLFLSQVDSLDVNTANQRIALSYADALYNWQLKGEQAKFDLNYAEVAKANQLVKQMKYELEKIMPEELQKIISERNINVLNLEQISAAITDLKASAKLKNEQSLTEEEKRSNLNAQTGLTEEQTAMYSKIQNKMLEVYGAQIENLKAQTGLTNEETYWYVFDLLNRSFPNGKIIGTAARIGHSQDITSHARNR